MMFRAYQGFKKQNNLRSDSFNVFKQFFESYKLREKMNKKDKG